MGVYIGKDVPDTQGPCPNGFHVPTKNELQSLYGYYTSLGLSGSANFVKFLKIPKSGYRYPDNANPTDVGTTGIYLSCERANANEAAKMQINGNISFAYNIQVVFGCQIRPFSDTVEAPDSSRTVLYQGSGNAGIYHNSILGIISISSDGTNWITIADKNLGATTVYNDGDTLSEANCGKYYQWGNNYGFPFTGSVTTSGSMVDASSYGPGNYYESNIFITASPRWDSTMNYNLRGGVSQGSTIKGVELKNAYIGEYRVPGSNTIAYYPLEKDVLDHSGNSRNLTNTNVSTTTLSGVECAYFNGSNSYLTYNGYSLGNTARTINVWCYINRPNSSSNNQGVIHICNPTSNSNLGGSFGLQFTNSTTVRTSDWNSASAESLTATAPSGWNNIVATQEGTTVKLYVNGNYIGIISNYPGQQASPNGWRLGASCRSDPGNYFKGYMSNAILENKVRTAQEVSDYYNLTKSNYGL